MVFARHPELLLGSVGVFKDKGDMTVKEVIQMNEISGKLVKIKNLFLTTPLNNITEKNEAEINLYIYM